MNWNQIWETYGLLIVIGGFFIVAFGYRKIREAISLRKKAKIASNVIKEQKDEKFSFDETFTAKQESESINIKIDDMKNFLATKNSILEKQLLETQESIQLQLQEVSITRKTIQDYGISLGVLFKKYTERETQLAKAIIDMEKVTGKEQKVITNKKPK